MASLNKTSRLKVFNCTGSGRDFSCSRFSVPKKVLGQENFGPKNVLCAKSCLFVEVVFFSRSSLFVRSSSLIKVVFICEVIFIYAVIFKTCADFPLLNWHRHSALTGNDISDHYFCPCLT